MSRCGQARKSVKRERSARGSLSQNLMRYGFKWTMGLVKEKFF